MFRKGTEQAVKFRMGALEGSDVNPGILSSMQTECCAQRTSRKKRARFAVHVSCATIRFDAVIIICL